MVWYDQTKEEEKAKKKSISQRDEKSRQEYWEFRRMGNREVAKTKEKAYIELYVMLRSKGLVSSWKRCAED